LFPVIVVLIPVFLYPPQVMRQFSFSNLLSAPAIQPTFSLKRRYEARGGGYGIVRKTRAGYPGSSIARGLLPRQNRCQWQLRSGSTSTICRYLPNAQGKWPILRCRNPYPHSIHWPLSFRFAPHEQCLSKNIACWGWCRLETSKNSDHKR